ncbi:hypothetical protein ACFLY4_05750 [Chloroflexota bacterium]
MNEFNRFKRKSTNPESVERAAFSMRHCPITNLTNNVLRASKETQRALRQLRQSLMDCHVCTAYENCELREHLNMQVDQVISEINEEWGW